MHGKVLIQRYYSELRNQWSVQALDELISPRIVFRGSIGTVVNGIDEFRAYVNRIRSAFPDFSNQIHKLIAEGEEVVCCSSFNPRARALYERLGYKLMAN